MSRISQLGQCLVEKYGLSEQESEVFVSSLFEIIREKLLTDNIVKVKGLGTFKLAEMNARESVSVNTGERITIEGRYKLSFTPENAVRDRINSPFASFESVDMDDDVDFSKIDEKYENKETTEESLVSAEESPAEANVIAPVIEPIVDFVEEPEEQTEEETVENTIEESAETPVETEPSAAYKTSLYKPSSDAPAEPKTPVEPNIPADSADPVNTETPEETKPQETPKEPEPQAEPEAKTTVVTEETSDPEPQNVQEKEVESTVRAPYCEELIHENVDHSKTIITLLHWLLGLVIAILLCIGGYLIYDVGRDNGAMEYYLRSSAVQKEEARRAAKYRVDTTKTDIEDNNKYDISLISSDKKTEKSAVQAKPQVAKPTDAKPTTKPVAKTVPAKPVAKTVPAKPVAKTAPTKPVAKPVPTKPAPTKVVSPKPTTKQNTKSEENSDISAIYNNKDARVRTGAYNIVGTQTTVTVLKGQTLKSITKCYLGEGMECYIEAYNGKKVFKAGDKIKIPKLKLKKRIKK